MTDPYRPSGEQSGDGALPSFEVGPGQGRGPVPSPYEPAIPTQYRPSQEQEEPQQAAPQPFAQQQYAPQQQYADQQQYPQQQAYPQQQYPQAHYPQQQYADQQAYPPPWTMPAPVSGQAIASLVLGIISLISCMGITAVPGLICWFLARRDLASGERSGQGLAIAGLITNVAGLLLLLLMIAMVAMTILGAATQY